MLGGARRSRGSELSSKRPTPEVCGGVRNGEGFRIGRTPESSAPARLQGCREDDFASLLQEAFMSTLCNQRLATHAASRSTLALKRFHWRERSMDDSFFTFTLPFLYFAV